MKILALGYIAYDTAYTLDRFPKENTFSKYQSKTEGVSGTIANASILLGRWNEVVDLVGIIGSDNLGSKITKELVLNRVGTKYLTLSPNTKTKESITLSNIINGSSTTITNSSSNKVQDDLKLTENADIILSDLYDSRTYGLFQSHPNSLKIISPRESNDDALQISPLANYLVCTLDYAEKVANIYFDKENKRTLVDIFNRMEQTYKTNIIIYLNDYGCLYRLDSQIRIMPTIKVKHIDLTASFDIFLGAFTYSLAKGFDLEQTLKYANVASALSKTRHGGYRSIPTLEEMNEVYDEVK